MKRILLALLGVAMFAGLASSAMAATASISWTIGVSYSANSIDLAATGLTANFGIVSANQIVYSNFGQGQPRSTIQNNGSGTIAYTVRANTTTGWALGAAPGVDTAELQGIFTGALLPSDTGADATSVTLTAAMFQANDVLTGSTQVATANIFADDNATNVLLKGYAVDPTLSSRSLRYKFTAPSSVVATGPTSINVTIGAQ
jgi:hypothetical protein